MHIYFSYKKSRPTTKRRRIKRLVLRISREFDTEPSKALQEQLEERKREGVAIGHGERHFLRS